uniref:Uncharacterized protein n=1 Tax=Hordeum vulgare subsp. vulgare TaxID=112509 RepID=A0A8I7BGF2_HORVV
MAFPLKKCFANYAFLAAAGDQCILALDAPFMESLEVAQWCRCWSACLLCLLQSPIQPCARSRQTGGMCTDHWTKPSEDFLKIRSLD